MESSVLTTTVLPLTLVLIMLGMGLGLTLDAFKQVLQAPRALILGLLAQLVMLPLISFAIASLFPLAPELAVGIVILAACPGGTTSNMLTYWSRGNIALSITLTVICSLVTIVSIPFVVNFGMQQFMSEAVALRLPILKTMLRIATITIIPVTCGMVTKRYLPRFAVITEKWVSGGACFGLVVIVIAIVMQEWAIIPGFFIQVGLVVLSLNLVTMLLGYGLAQLAKLDAPSTKAITIEVGIQNAALAITIASTPSLLNQPSMAIPAVVYGLLMYVTGGVFVWSLRRQPQLHET